MFKIISSQIADSIDIKAIKAALDQSLIHSDSDELFYEVGPYQFIYIFRYGVIAFSNPQEKQINDFILFAGPFCKNPFKIQLTDEIWVETNASENRFGHTKIELVKPSVEALRIIMLNVSQSVALDYYSNQTELLLQETNQHTLFLEMKGKLEISGRQLNRFIGKIINFRNKINETLYIFDSVPETWENEELYKIDIELKKTFDLQSRFRNIQEELEIIKENLSLLIDLMHQRRSSLLEVVVIVLIMVEVINLLLEKIF